MDDQKTESNERDKNLKFGEIQNLNSQLFNTLYPPGLNIEQNF